MKLHEEAILLNSKSNTNANLQDSLDKTSLADRTYLLLRDWIVTTKLKPGEHLSISALSKELGVSSTPVRDAIKMLERDRLVEVRPRSGNFVSMPTKSDLIEIFDMMTVLETLSVRLAIPNFPNEEIDELCLKMYEARDLIQNGNNEAYISSDTVFHKTILKYSKNSWLQFTLVIMDTYISWIRHLLASSLGRPLESSQMHCRIVDAIKGKKADMAVTLMEEHIRQVKETAVLQFDWFWCKK